MDRSRVFESAAGEAAAPAACDAAMTRWPVPSRRLDVPTRFGPTHGMFDGQAAVDRAVRVLARVEADLIPDRHHAIVCDRTGVVRDRRLAFLSGPDRGEA